jgi:hypothetical protein
MLMNYLIHINPQSSLSPCSWDVAAFIYFLKFANPSERGVNTTKTHQLVLSQIVHVKPCKIDTFWTDEVSGKGEETLA